MSDTDLDRIIANLRAQREKLAEAMRDAEITREQRQKLREAIKALDEEESSAAPSATEDCNT